MRGSGAGQAGHRVEEHEEEEDMAAETARSVEETFADIAVTWDDIREAETDTDIYSGGGGARLTDHSELKAWFAETVARCPSPDYPELAERLAASAVDWLGQLYVASDNPDELPLPQQSWLADLILAFVAKHNPDAFLFCFSADAIERRHDAANPMETVFRLLYTQRFKVVSSNSSPETRLKPSGDPTAVARDLADSINLARHYGLQELISIVDYFIEAIEDLHRQQGAVNERDSLVQGLARDLDPIFRLFCAYPRALPLAVDLGKIREVYAWNRENSGMDRAQEEEWSIFKAFLLYMLLVPGHTLQTPNPPRQDTPRTNAALSYFFASKQMFERKYFTELPLSERVFRRLFAALTEESWPLPHLPDREGVKHGVPLAARSLPLELTNKTTLALFLRFCNFNNRDEISEHLHKRMQVIAKNRDPSSSPGNFSWEKCRPWRNLLRNLVGLLPNLDEATVVFNAVINAAFSNDSDKGDWLRSRAYSSDNDSERSWGPDSRSLEEWVHWALDRFLECWLGLESLRGLQQEREGVEQVNPKLDACFPNHHSNSHSHSLSGGVATGQLGGGMATEPIPGLLRRVELRGIFDVLFATRSEGTEQRIRNASEQTQKAAIGVLSVFMQKVGVAGVVGGDGWMRVDPMSMMMMEAFEDPVVEIKPSAMEESLPLFVLDRLHVLLPLFRKHKDALPLVHAVYAFLRHHTHSDTAVEHVRKELLSALERDVANWGSRLSEEKMARMNDVWDRIAGISTEGTSTSTSHGHQGSASGIAGGGPEPSEPAEDPHSQLSEQEKAGLERVLSMAADGKGLSNLGNTCFMNSLLQSVFASSSIPLYEVNEFVVDEGTGGEEKVRKMIRATMRDELIAFHFSLDARRPEQPTPTDALSRLFALLLFSVERSLTPKEFLATQPSWMRSGRQQDAAEFMKLLFDQIEADVKAADKERKERLAEGGVGAVAAMMGKLADPLRHFRGQTVTAIACLGGCKGVSYRGEDFTDLTVPFKVEEIEEVVVESAPPITSSGLFESTGKTFTLGPGFGSSLSSSSTTTKKPTVVNWGQQATTTTSPHFTTVSAGSLLSSAGENPLIGPLLPGDIKLGDPPASPAASAGSEPTHEIHLDDENKTEIDENENHMDSRSWENPNAMSSFSPLGGMRASSSVGKLIWKRQQGAMTGMLNAAGELVDMEVGSTDGNADDDDEEDLFHQQMLAEDDLYDVDRVRKERNEEADLDMFAGGTDLELELDDEQRALWLDFGEKTNEDSRPDPDLHNPVVIEVHPLAGGGGGSSAANVEGMVEMGNEENEPPHGLRGGAQPIEPDTRTDDVQDSDLVPTLEETPMDDVATQLDATQPLPSPQLPVEEITHLEGGFIHPQPPIDFTFQSAAATAFPTSSSTTPLEAGQARQTALLRAEIVRSFANAGASGAIIPTGESGTASSSTAPPPPLQVPKPISAIPPPPAPAPAPPHIRKIRKIAKATLQEMLEAMFISEHLNEANGNAYACDRCGRKTHATRTTYLQQVPNVLIVTVNRFEYDMTSGRRKKIMDAVEGDWSCLRADVLVRDVVKEQAEAEQAEKERKEKEGSGGVGTPAATSTADSTVVNNGVPGPSRVDTPSDKMDVDQTGSPRGADTNTVASEERTAASDEATSMGTTADEGPALETKPVYYDLHAVVFHSGYSADYGHYYAYAVQERVEEGAMPRKPSELAAESAKVPWTQYNDSSVRRNLMLDDVFADARNGDTPYILFYKRRPEGPPPADAVRDPAILRVNPNTLISFVKDHDRTSSTGFSSASFRPASSGSLGLGLNKAGPSSSSGSHVLKRARRDSDEYDKDGGFTMGMNNFPQWGA